MITFKYVKKKNYMLQSKEADQLTLIFSSVVYRAYLYQHLVACVHILTRDILDLERTESHENMSIIKITQHNSGMSHSHAKLCVVLQETFERSPYRSLREEHQKIKETKYQCKRIKTYILLHFPLTVSQNLCFKYLRYQNKMLFLLT